MDAASLYAELVATPAYPIAAAALVGVVVRFFRAL